MDRLLLSTEEVATALGIGRSRAYTLIARGELPSIRVGRLIRVRADALQAWIATRTQGEAGEGSPATR